MQAVVKMCLIKQIVWTRTTRLQSVNLVVHHHLKKQKAVWPTCISCQGTLYHSTRTAALPSAPVLLSSPVRQWFQQQLPLVCWYCNLQCGYTMPLVDAAAFHTLWTEHPELQQLSQTFPPEPPGYYKQNKNKLVRFHVLMVVNMKMTASWDTTPCNLIEVDWHFRGANCLHHQGNE
jgi:hypothetical protein